MKAALFGVAVLAQIATNPAAKIRSGTVEGTVAVTPDIGDPNPDYKGTCANLVASAKVGSLKATAKATGSPALGCAFSIPGVPEGGATVTLAFDGAPFPAGDLASTPATVRSGETAKVAMKVTWPAILKQTVAIVFDYTGFGGSCNGMHAKVAGSKSFDVELKPDGTTCKGSVFVVPGTWTFTLYTGINPNQNFQPQTVNVVNGPGVPVIFKMPVMAGVSARFHPKVTSPAGCSGLVFTLSQGGVLKQTLPMQPFFTDHCYANSASYPIATPVLLEVKSGNTVLSSATKTLTYPNTLTWETSQQ